MGFLQWLAFELTIKPRIKRLQKLLPEAGIMPTGSKYVCSPPMFGTDIDFLVYAKSIGDYLMFAETLIADKWKQPSKGDMREYHQQGHAFTTWRKGVVNLVMSEDEEFVENFQTATHFCKMHNLKIKTDRVAVHAVLCGEQPYVEMASRDYYPHVVDVFLKKMTGANGIALRKAYRAKHGLELP